jgi:hypothetical protein
MIPREQTIYLQSTSIIYKTIRSKSCSTDGVLISHWSLVYRANNAHLGCKRNFFEPYNESKCKKTTLKDYSDSKLSWYTLDCPKPKRRGLGSGGRTTGAGIKY